MTKFVYSSSNCTGYLRIDSANVAPPSILVLMSSSMFFMRGLDCPLAMMSRPCTIGTPAAIITAIWRLNTAISRGLIVRPVEPNSGLGLGLIVVALMP